MRMNEFRQRLIDATVHVIARDGLDKASAKQIENLAGINVVYIYRCFKDKEDMFAKTFSSLDEELAVKAMQHVCVIYMPDIEFELRWRHYFFAVWELLLSSREKCLTYVQYYYSPYFVKNSMVEHKQRYMPLVEKFKAVFKDEADVWMLLSHILNVMLDFAIKVHNTDMPNTDEYVEHVFRVIYASVEQYFRKNEDS